MKNVCLKCGGPRGARSQRGQCGKCAGKTRYAVEVGRTTWEEEERLGFAESLATGKARRNRQMYLAVRKRRNCLDDGGREG